MSDITAGFVHLSLQSLRNTRDSERTWRSLEGEGDGGVPSNWNTLVCILHRHLSPDETLQDPQLPGLW